jgi:asparagine synthase (glutamine-hydrolysing)
MAQTLYRDGKAADNGFASYSYLFEGLECDERDLIQDIQNRYGFPARYLTDSSSLGWLDVESQRFLEAPTTAVSTRTTLYQAATADGVRVLLTGLTADGYVGGSPLVFDSLLRQGRLRELGQRFAGYRQFSNEPLRNTLALHCLAPLLPLKLQKRVMAAYVERSVRRILPRLMPFWMSEALRQDLGARHLAQCLAEERARRSPSPAQEAAYRLLAPPPNHRSPFGWSMELADPFADRRLQTFMMAIPPEQKFARLEDREQYYGATKWLVRRAMQGILPDSIRTRNRKTYFSDVYDSEIVRNWGAFQAAFGPTARPEIVQRGYVDHARFWDRLQQMRAGAGGVDAYYLMRLVGLETWLRSLALPRERLTRAPSRSFPGSSPPSQPLRTVGVAAENSREHRRAPVLGLTTGRSERR